MAESKANKDTVQKDVVQKKDFNPDAKITVRNIAGWNVGFKRIVDVGFGDVTVAARGSVRLSGNEILAQIQNGNPLLAGIDGVGTHATLIIEDDAARIEAGFDSEDGSRKQRVYSDQLIVDLFKITNQSQFESKFKENIVTRAEKFASINTIKDKGLNDFKKIRFVEKYTGYTVDAR